MLETIIKISLPKSPSVACIPSWKGTNFLRDFVKNPPTGLARIHASIRPLRHLAYVQLLAIVTTIGVDVKKAQDQLY